MSLGFLLCSQLNVVWQLFCSEINVVKPTIFVRNRCHQLGAFALTVPLLCFDVHVDFGHGLGDHLSSCHAERVSYATRANPFTTAPPSDRADLAMAKPGGSPCNAACLEKLILGLPHRNCYHLPGRVAGLPAARLSSHSVIWMNHPVVQRTTLPWQRPRPADAAKPSKHVPAPHRSRLRQSG